MTISKARRTAKEDTLPVAGKKPDIKFMTMYNIAVAQPYSEARHRGNGALMHFVRGTKQDAINYFAKLVADGEFEDIVDEETGEVLVQNQDTSSAKIIAYAEEGMYEEDWVIRGTPANYDVYDDLDYLYTMEDTIGFKGEKYKSEGEGNWLLMSHLQEWIPGFGGGDFDGYDYVIAFDWYSRTAYEIVKDYLIGSKRNVDSLGKDLYDNYDIIAQEVKQGKPFKAPAFEIKGWN